MRRLEQLFTVDATPCVALLVTELLVTELLVTIDATA